MKMHHKPGCSIFDCGKKPLECDCGYLTRKPPVQHTTMNGRPVAVLDMSAEEMKTGLELVSKEKKMPKAEQGETKANYKLKCMVCESVPTVDVRAAGSNEKWTHTELCGPCCFGESACADPSEWATVE